MHTPDRHLATHRTEASYALDWWHGPATTKSERRRRRDARRSHSRAVRRHAAVEIATELDDAHAEDVAAANLRGCEPTEPMCSCGATERECSGAVS